MCHNVSSFISIHTNQEVYESSNEARILAAVIAYLSALGSLLIILTYVFVKDLRRVTVRLILVFVSIAELVASVSNGTGALRNFVSVDCQLQAGVTVAATLSSIFWSFSLAIYLYISIARNDVRLAKNLLFPFHAICWPVPIGIAIVTYFEGALGSTFSTTTVGWCWVKDEPATPENWSCQKSRALWTMITLKGWECLSYIFLPFLYWRIKRHIDKQADESSSDAQPLSPALKKAVRSVDVKLRFIPLIYVLLRVWGTVRVFLDITDGNKDLSSTGYKAFLYLQALGDNSHGIVHFILFICLTEVVRTKLRKTFSGVQTDYLYHRWNVHRSRNPDDEALIGEEDISTGTKSRSRSRTNTSELSVFRAGESVEYQDASLVADEERLDKSAESYYSALTKSMDITGEYNYSS